MKMSAFSIVGRIQPFMVKGGKRDEDARRRQKKRYTFPHPSFDGLNMELYDEVLGH